MAKVTEQASAPGPSGTADPAGDWTAILDRLEVGISLAFAGEASGWQPAASPGPIPAELVERARRLLDALYESEVALAMQQQNAARHLEALDSIPDSRDTGRSRLLDVQG